MPEECAASTEAFDLTRLEDTMTKHIDKLPVFILTGSTGLTGLHNVRMYLEQFSGLSATPRIFPMIATNEKIEEVALKAKTEGAILVHTFMRKDLAAHTNEVAAEHGVACIDLASGPISVIEKATGLASAQTPGHVHYHGHAAVPQALRFAHTHDDGGGVRQLDIAHIVLVGLSGAGKTEVAYRLSLYGLWVGNVPIVSGVGPSDELGKVVARRVYYLDVSPEQLEARRRERWDATAGPEVEAQYVDLEAIKKEVTTLRRLVASNKEWKTVRATGKTVAQIVASIIEKYQDDFPLS